MNKIKVSKGEKAFPIINYIILGLIILITIYPMWYILCASFSNASRLTAYSGLLWKPLEFTFKPYEYVGQNPMILKGYMNTIFVVVTGVVINIVMTSVAAYVLSRQNLMFKNAIAFFIIFTMFFSGGTIPFYFSVINLGLENSLWALILPASINTYYLIIMRTSFSSIPQSLEEAAKIDGAGHVRILVSIILPVSKAILSVMVLYYAVFHWNSWFNAMLFLSDREKYPLQLVLREILIQNDTSNMMTSVGGEEQYSVGESIKYAVIVISTVPILCIYPFIQKYFVQGTMAGAVKG